MRHQAARCRHGSATVCTCEEARLQRNRVAKAYRCRQITLRTISPIGLERRLRGLVMEGFTRAEIAAQFGTSKRAVDYHLHGAHETTSVAMLRTVEDACRNLLTGPRPTGREALFAQASARRNGWWPLGFWRDIDTDPEPIATALVDGVGTRRRMQGLVARGHSKNELSTRLGQSHTTVRELLHRQKTTLWMAAQVEAFYDVMLLERAPGGLGADRIRRAAEREGFWPPEFWIDIDTDPEPGLVEDDVDEITVMHAVAGDMYWEHLGTAEKRIVVAELDRRGYGLPRMVAQLRATEKRVWDVLDEVRHGPRDKRRRKAS